MEEVLKEKSVKCFYRWYDKLEKRIAPLKMIDPDFKSIAKFTVDFEDIAKYMNLLTGVIT